MTRKTFLHIALGAAAALTIAAGVACGGDDGDKASRDGATSGDQPVVSGGAQTVPNTMLTFEGARYRLSDIQQADLIDAGEFERIGAATEADIDYEGELAVYSRSGDDGAVWTRMEAREGAEGEGTPALWYRWAPDSEGGPAE